MTRQEANEKQAHWLADVLTRGGIIGVKVIGDTVSYSIALGDLVLLRVSSVSVVDPPGAVKL